MTEKDEQRHKTLLHYALERMDRRIRRLQRARERLARHIENSDDKTEDKE